MTEPNVQGQETPVTDTPALAQEPARSPYADYLEPLPESVRPLVEPAFKEWDAEVTKKFQSLHSEYEPYKPLIDEYEADSLQQAVALVNFMQENPQEFFKQMSAAFELQPEQGTANATVDPVNTDDPDPYDERFGKLETMLEQLAQVIISEREQQTLTQQEQELENLVSGLKEKHGEFDELTVLTWMSQGMDPDVAVQQWKDTLTQYATKLNAPNNNAPTVVSANGGGYAQEPVQPKDLSSQDTKALVAQMLAAAHEQSRG